MSCGHPVAHHTGIILNQMTDHGTGMLFIVANHPSMETYTLNIIINSSEKTTCQSHARHDISQKEILSESTLEPGLT